MGGGSMRARVVYMVPVLWCLATPSLAATFAQSSYSEHLTPDSGASTGYSCY